MDFVKTIRDPIHGLIRLTEKEVRIIDVPLFQRLRRIQQLALTNYVFPGAVHTRFEHSLGTLEMAQRCVGALAENGTRLKPEEHEVLRYAALLHDIGHGPFSHVAENFFVYPEEDGRKLGHEKASVDIIRIHPQLEFLEGLREPVAELLEEWKGSKSHVRDIVTSALDADKMDY